MQYSTGNYTYVLYNGGIIGNFAMEVGLIVFLTPRHHTIQSAVLLWNESSTNCLCISWLVTRWVTRCRQDCTWFLVLERNWRREKLTRRKKSASDRWRPLPVHCICNI